MGEAEKEKRRQGRVIIWSALAVLMVAVFLYSKGHPDVPLLDAVMGKIALLTSKSPAAYNEQGTCACQVGLKCARIHRTVDSHLLKFHILFCRHSTPHELPSHIFHGPHE
jgi:hypothetical protein